MKTPRSLTLLMLADTHEMHWELDTPPADILLFAGDLGFMSRTTAALLDFNNWLGELPHRHKIIIPGNHELILEAEPHTRSILTNATVLINESVDVESLKIWGSPVTPQACGAFGMPSENDRRKLYASIPADTDIVLTHTPPYGILDTVPGPNIHAGCPELLAAVRRIRPRLHVFGHIHASRGKIQSADTTFVNASLLGRDGDLEGRPFLFRMQRFT